jgi:REP element-mobilizing transposase RayT
MSSTLSNLTYHIVFSTKYREPSFQDEFVAILKKQGVDFDERYLFDVVGE